PTVEGAVPTRMIEKSEAGVYRGAILDRGTRVVVVGVIRAGIIPSQGCFDMLNMVLEPANVRLDYLHMARRAGRRGGGGGGSPLGGRRTGGRAGEPTPPPPDRRGAPASPTWEVVRHSRRRHGTPAKIVCMPMIATPESLRRVLDEVPGAVVYTSRLDR